MVPLFRERGAGRVVAISSFATKTPYAGAGISNAFRAALVGGLKTAALELGGEGILINAVGPGYIETERLIEFNQAYARREGIEPSEVASRTLARIPLRRYGKPEELAEVVAFLLSPQNGYVTGQHILIDGGLVSAS